MVTITREGDEEREGGVRKRVVEKLRNIAATAGTVLSQKDGIVGKVVETIGSTPFDRQYATWTVLGWANVL